MEGQMRCLIGSGLCNRKGMLGLRNLLFYCKEQASLPFVLEGVSKNSLQKQAGPGKEQ